MGPKGLEPSLAGLKVRCAAVTPRPRNADRAYAFPPGFVHIDASCSSVVALRIELSATRLSAVSWQPALDYRLSRAPRSRTRPRRSRKQNHCLLLPKQACYHLHLCPISCLCKSERLDSNQRSPGPGPSAITRLRYVLFRLVCSSSCGSRTQPARLERPMTSPEVERAVLCAHCERGVGREVLEPSSAVLQTAAIPSQLPAQVVVRARKNPMSLSLVTPGS